MSLANGTAFIAASSGTVDFVFASQIPSLYSPAQAFAAGELTDGGSYSYFAVDSVVNPTQREWGIATYTHATQTFARTTVLGGISNGVSSGAGTKVNFAFAPTVALTLLGSTVNTGILFDNAGVISGNLNLTFDGTHVTLGGFLPQMDVFNHAVQFQTANTSGLNSADFRLYQNNAEAPYISFTKSRGASIGSYVAVQSGDDIGYITFAGVDVATNLHEAAAFEVSADAAPTSGSVPGRIVFRTAATGSAFASERLRIDSNGRVNIGVGGAQLSNFKNANGTLELVSNGNQDWSQIIYNVNFGGSLVLATTAGATPTTQTLVGANSQIFDVIGAASDGAAYQVAARIRWSVDGAPAANSMPGRLQFLTVPSGSTIDVERMRIDSKGNVTVGDATYGNTATLASAASHFQVVSTDGLFFTQWLQYGNNNNDPSVLFAKTRGATPSTHGAVVAGNDWLGELDWIGSDGTQWIVGGSVVCTVDAVSTGHLNSSIVLHTYANGTGYPQESFRVDSKGNVVVAGIGNGGAIGTSATDGFLYLETCAGAPTGTPTSYTGRVPAVFDTTNNKIWFYTGGAWKGVVVA